MAAAPGGELKGSEYVETLKGEAGAVGASSDAGPAARPSTAPSISLCRSTALRKLTRVSQRCDRHPSLSCISRCIFVH